MTLSKNLRLSSLTLLALAAAGARAEKIYGITTTDGLVGAGLVSFDSATPANSTVLGALSGVVAGQAVRAIDFRPATGTLYALSSSTAPGVDRAAQLYTVNLTSGALTTVGSGFTLLGANSSVVSIDFNPTVDRLRVVSGGNGNYRVNPNDGSLAATDTSINPSALIADVAYTNSVAGATQTTLFAYNYSGDTLDRIGGVNGTPSPNLGARTTVGASGVVSGFTDIGFDISGATGIGYVNLDDVDSLTFADEFYTVNLGTGALTLVSSEIGVDLLDISVAIAPPVPEPATMAALGVGALVVLRRRRKA